MQSSKSNGQKIDVGSSRRWTANRVAPRVIVAASVLFFVWVLEPWSGRRYIARVQQIVNDPANKKILELEVQHLFEKAEMCRYRGDHIELVGLKGYSVLSQFGDAGVFYSSAGSAEYASRLAVRNGGGRLWGKIQVLHLFDADPAPGINEWYVHQGHVRYRLSAKIFVSGDIPASAFRSWRNVAQRRNGVSPKAPIKTGIE